MRVGMGYDSHRLVAGRPLILGGVRVPFELGLKGHSDADALIHAIVDALLGAAGLGDIGSHFPDSDPQYKDRSSLFFLEEAGRLVAQNGFRITNIDATVIAQAPKLGPYFPQMAETMGHALGARARDISLKAKTNEGMGLVGRSEGMAVFAVALLEEV